MKKIVKPHKARKPSASTDVPSFARGKDQILKSSARLQRRKKNELGEFDDGKNLEFREVPQWQYVDDGSGNLGIVDTNTGQIGTFALPELTVSTPRPIYAPKPWQYSSTFDGSLDNTLNTLDAMTGGTIGMAPILGDALDGLNVVNDVNKGDYTNAGIGLGLLALPNFIEKPLRGIKKGVKWGKDQIWLAKTLNNFGTGLRNPWIRDKWKTFMRNPSLVRDYDKYVTNWHNLNLNQMKESLPQLQQFNTDFPGLKKIESDYHYSIDPNSFLQQASETLNRAKYYAGGYHKLMNKIKSSNSTLYNIAKESPQYAQQIYNDLINNRIGNTENYVKSLIDQSNTFMRGMKKVDPKTNPQAYLTIAGRSMGSATPAMDVGSPAIVLGGDYGVPVIYKPKNRQLTGPVDTWWSQRTPNFKDKSITITPASMWTGNAKQSAHLIPGGFKNDNAASLERILNDYLYHSGNVDIPGAYGRSASHMTFWSPNKGASIADQFDIIPASDVDLNTIKFGLGYRKGKDSASSDDSVIQNTAAYNQWRSTLPKNLQTETPDYDLYGAFQAGLQPEWNNEDNSYHLGSRDPKTGRILKRPGHPTFGQAIYNDMLLGYYPIYRDGEIYTEQPLKYNKGKDSGIHIKKKNRGKFTAAAKRAGMGVQAYARKILSAPKGKYSPTLRRRASFAKAASKFKH